MTLQRETGPLEREPVTRFTADQNGFGHYTVHTRSAESLGDHLDAHAVEHVTQMVEQGWDSQVARESWVGWAQNLVEAAGDAAIAEVAWEASP